MPWRTSPVASDQDGGDDPRRHLDPHRTCANASPEAGRAAAQSGRARTAVSPIWLARAANPAAAVLVLEAGWAAAEAGRRAHPFPRSGSCLRRSSAPSLLPHFHLPPVVRGALPGVPISSLPFLLCETKNPNPTLGQLAICIRTLSNYMCVLCLILRSHSKVIVSTCAQPFVVHTCVFLIYCSRTLRYNPNTNRNRHT